jgi:hypothetical protein
MGETTIQNEVSLPARRSGFPTDGTDGDSFGSIYDAFERVTEYPDYVWGTVFTLDDVAEIVEDMIKDGELLASERETAVTMDAGDVLRTLLLEASSWRETLKEMVLAQTRPCQVPFPDTPKRPRKFAELGKELGLRDKLTQSRIGHGEAR